MDEEIIKLEVALEADAEQIRDLMIRVERDETDRWYDNGERPFIPGYDSVDMQKYHMWDKKYYKIMYDNALAGVLLISYTGRDHARVDRFYIDPAFQNKKLGSRVISLMEEMYPMVRIWSLDTIQKSTRNHKFYEKNGYKKVEEDEEERYYCKIIEDLTDNSETHFLGENLSNRNFHDCNMENVDIYYVNMKKAKFTNISLEESLYQNANLSGARLTNLNMSKTVLGDSNLSQIEICHVSLSDAYIHDNNLGFQESKKPLTIERCELTNSKIIDSNLHNVSICNCNTEGMTIDGVLVSELMEVYRLSINFKK